MWLFLEILAAVCLFSSVWLSFLYHSSLDQPKLDELNPSLSPLPASKVIPFERALNLRKS